MILVSLFEKDKMPLIYQYQLNVSILSEISLRIFDLLHCPKPLKNKEKVRPKSGKSDIVCLIPKIVRFMMPE